MNTNDNTVANLIAAVKVALFHLRRDDHLSVTDGRSVTSAMIASLEQALAAHAQAQQDTRTCDDDLRDFGSCFEVDGQRVDPSRVRFRFAQTSAAEPVAVLHVLNSGPGFPVCVSPATKTEWDKLRADHRILEFGVPVYLHPPVQPAYSLTHDERDLLRTAAAFCAGEIGRCDPVRTDKAVALIRRISGQPAQEIEVENDRCVICHASILPKDHGLCDVHKYEEDDRAEQSWENDANIQAVIAWSLPNLITDGTSDSGYEAARRHVREMLKSKMSLNEQHEEKGWIGVQRQVPAVGQRIIGRNARWGMWEEVWNGKEPLGQMVAWIPFPDNASAVALARAGVAMEVRTYPTVEGRAFVVLVPATSREKHQVFNSPEDLADWLDKFYETSEDCAITGRKWPPAQVAMRVLRAEYQRNLILLYMPELAVDTSRSANPELRTEYTLSPGEVETAIETLIEREKDQLDNIALEIYERMVENADTPAE